ncbi:MAG: hypothetical protein ABR564_03020 [Candidatus Dormibacteria bacterium]
MTATRPAAAVRGEGDGDDGTVAWPECAFGEAVEAAAAPCGGVDTPDTRGDEVGGTATADCPHAARSAITCAV